ncbi:TetR/AcrR family transcriptional regulator [Neptunicoccus cionae]|uniref:TetR family transcriptional regulator n=1 Tax=Neptunicoccus cionae TaxID=2035344 RepID=A0A916R0T3_9RHOB|nr:TetR/AcrR family transcriptional regulator [Amylibacter cionae]GGA25380.1 TetR family transcriptional regulator [Amylibacter cionae]
MIYKRESRKREIAQSAINALRLYGYVRTTLRNIAAQSDMSMGSLHYYFEDNDELLIYCVQQYKSAFVETIIAAVQGLSTRKDIRTAFCHAMAETNAGEAELHRLWYDIRNQAMFDNTFVPVVGSIEDQLIEMVSPFADTRAQKELLYLRLDGAFRYLLQLQLTDNPRSLAEMTSVFEAIAE